MIKYLAVVLCFVMFGFATSTATAEPANKSTASTESTAPYQVAAWNDRICCKRGWQDWRTTRRACNRAGGRQVRDRQCRDDWNDNWDVRWFGWSGRDWSKRVCCKQGRRDWWSTARQCREAGGWQANARQCRNG
jgi:hypothetical protein